MTARVLPPAVGDGKAVRLTCCIPFCRRTFANGKNGTPWPERSEVICGRHWRLVDKPTRARHRRAWKLVEKIEQRHGKQRTWHFARMTAFRIWDRIKVQATEAAVGIA